MKLVEWVFLGCKGNRKLCSKTEREMGAGDGPPIEIDVIINEHTRLLGTAAIALWRSRPTRILTIRRWRPGAAKNANFDNNREPKHEI